jgi:hypothetical protein
MGAANLVVMPAYYGMPYPVARAHTSSVLDLPPLGVSLRYIFLMIGINSISKASTTMKFEIVNIVATADLRQQVELTEIAKIRYTIHDQEIYGGRVAYLKTPAMHGKTTIFPSGKLISVGTKTREQAQHDL